MDKIKFLFEDQHLAVFSKPAGLLSQGGEGADDHLVIRLQQHFGRPYVGLVHRLDRNTSGLMVAAKRTKAADRLSKAIQKGELERSYLALMAGHLPQKKVAEHWLHKNESSNLVRAFDSQKAAPKDSKYAKTTFTPVLHLDWKQNSLTLCECVLETGRSHQIRAQALALGHPLVGDKKYQYQGPEFSRTALHSYCLEFSHPMSSEKMKFLDTVPADMLELLKNPERDFLQKWLEQKSPATK